MKTTAILGFMTSLAIATMVGAKCFASDLVIKNETTETSLNYPTEAQSTWVDALIFDSSKNTSIKMHGAFLNLDRRAAHFVDGNTIIFNTIPVLPGEIELGENQSIEIIQANGASLPQAVLTFSDALEAKGFANIFSNRCYDGEFNIHINGLAYDISAEKVFLGQELHMNVPMSASEYGLSFEELDIYLPKNPNNLKNTDANVRPADISSQNNTVGDILKCAASCGEDEMNSFCAKLKDREQ